MTNRSSLLLSVAFIATLLGVGVCSAASITYNVDQTIGAGSVVGTVQTDGTIGGLTTANFTDWNLLLTGLGGATFTLTQGNSVVLDGTYSSGFVLATAGNSDVTAATSSLLFNFSATDHGFFGIQQGAVVFSGEEYWCNAASGNGACYSPGASVAPVSNVDASFQVEARTGNEVIGTVNATPLPSTWLMLLSGFVGLGFFAYRGTKKAAALAAA